MKKHCLLAILFISLTIKSYGQHVPVLNDGAVWRQGINFCNAGFLGTYCSGWYYFDFNLSNDTLINNLQYKIVKEWQYSTNYAYLREDDGKVYLKYDAPKGKCPYYSPLYHPVDTSEFMLYDFTLNVGDTFTTRVFRNQFEFQNPAFPEMEYVEHFIVKSVDYVTLHDLTPRKQLTLESLTPLNYDESPNIYWGGTLKWIAGIGSTKTFFYNEAGYYARGLYEGEIQKHEIACYSLAGENLWGDLECPKTEDKKLNLYPNPVSNTLIVPDFEDTTDYRLYDLLGKLVKSGTTTNNQIDVGELPIGMYVLAVTENTTGKIYRSRIIKQ